MNGYDKNYAKFYFRINIALFSQVVEAARDCLSKSKDGLLSSGYFIDLSENLQRLLYEVRVWNTAQRQKLLLIC